MGGDTNHAPARLLPDKFDLIPNTVNLTTDLRDREEDADTSDDNYSDPEPTGQPSDNDNRNRSNTGLDFEYTQDVD